MPSKCWRWIQLESASYLSTPMRDPVDFATWRVEQNVHAGIDECAYFRQSGRTHRLALRVLDHAYKNETCIVFFQTRSWAQIFADLLQNWSDQISLGLEMRTSGSGSMLRHRTGGVKTTVTHLTPFGLDHDPMFRGTSYDYVYFDNDYLDIHVGIGKQVSKLFHDTTSQARHLLSRKDRGKYADGIIDFEGDLWRSGDLFTLPGFSSIGTIVDLNRVECIPIGLTVLYNGDLIQMPWDACDVLLKTTDVS